jgi:hypothetical protein
MAKGVCVPMKGAKKPMMKPEDMMNGKVKAPKKGKK